MKGGSAYHYAEMVGAFAEIAAQRVLNPMFFEENGTYNMCSFVTPYSFHHSYRRMFGQI